MVLYKNVIPKLILTHGCNFLFLGLEPNKSYVRLFWTLEVTFNVQQFSKACLEDERDFPAEIISALCVLACLDIKSGS